VQQIGFGWGKGRRVIKTFIAGEALTRALAKQQRFVDELRAAVSGSRLSNEKQKPEKLHMAKARVRPSTRGPN
jgi:hypothetical protein